MAIHLLYAANSSIETLSSHSPMLPHFADREVVMELVDNNEYIITDDDNSDS